MGEAIRIETPRLILRDFVASEVEAVQSYASRPAVVRHMHWGPNSIQDSEAFVKHVLDLQAQNPRRFFELAVTLKSTGQVIGAAGIRHQSIPNRSGDLGYVLHEDHWGQGLGTEIANALVNFGFTQLKLHRIWATARIENTASQNVLKKAGMRQEGIMRDHVFARGEWHDSVLYSILEGDPR